MNAKEIILEQIIAAMEAGTLDWTRTWSGTGGLPRNYVSKKPYRGINMLIAMWSEFKSPFWLTYKQAADLGGHVRAGEKATKIVFWKPTEYADKQTGEMKEGVVLRYSNVFNAEQIDGIDFPVPESKNKEMADLTHITGLAAKIGVDLQHSTSDRAFYNPSRDFIHLPEQVQFNTDADYAHTFLHELVHSTGHESRTGRLKKNRETFDSFNHSYAYEELVAELGQSFLCADLGVRPDIHNSAAYIQGWAKRLKQEPDLLFKAAGAAQKAIDFIFATPDTDDSAE